MLLTLLSVSAQEYTPNQILFKTSRSIEIQRGRTGLTAFDAYLNDVQALSVSPIKGMHGNRWFSAHLAAQPDWNAIKNNSLRFDGIDVIQPNYLNTFHVIPNDPWYSVQQLNLVELPNAWNYTTGSSMLIVGVVDSGILKNHPDLMDNIYYNTNEIPDNGIDDDNNGYVDDYCGWDFADAPEMNDVALGDYIGQDNDVTDENFHGTHVSGILGAVSNNGIGISGVCWNVKILPLRAGFRTTTGTGFLQDDDAAAALIYGADMGVSVMNLSWGDPNYSPIIADACNYAYERGITLVASAGNDPGPYLSYPAKLSSVISVGAIDPYRNLAGFSSYGPELDLVAPGQQIYSTYKADGVDMYKEQSGTSMSSPFVAGAVALLKSILPNLTPDEVKARILTTTDDIGPDGFDMYFGHGLLNVRKLLEDISSPLVQVIYPADNIGVSGNFDIIGTVNCDNFFRYSVMYAMDEGSVGLIWQNVDTDIPWYYEPVIDNVIAHFGIPDLMQEGPYIIRIQYESFDGSMYNVFRSVNIDQSAPYMTPTTFQIFKRYEGQNVRYYAGALFNEPVRSELHIYTSDMTHYTAFPAKLDSIQVWQLPNNIPQGSVDVQILATNNSNLTYTSPYMINVINLQYEIVPNYGYESQPIGNAMVPLNRFYDFDQNGTPEFLAMDLPATGYGTDRFFELNDTTLIEKHIYTNNFLPLDLGDTNNSGQEILALNLDTATLYETFAANQYPEVVLWQDTGISGGIIADYDNDGIKDILLVKNLPSERVINLHKRISTTQISSSKITLHNTTETNVRNMFVPTVICRNLDNDNLPDILAADTDGDIMIFEVTGSESAVMTWTHRLPVNNTYYLTSGDYDGNGTTDFMVGGYNTDVLDPNQTYWFFEGFTRSSNNQYTSMGSIQFNQVMSQNAIQSFDIDGDSKMEIIMSLSPNLFILKYINGKFQPVFYGNSNRTYQIAAWSQNNQTYFLTNQINSLDSLTSVVWSKQAPFTGPPTPANLIVKPLRENRVSLTWQTNGADYYRIYRKDANNPEQVIAEVTTAAYTDTTVVEGIPYSYAISAYDSSYSPQESNPSQWLIAIPMPQPSATSITMIGANELRIVFSQPLASSALNPGCYRVDHDMGVPLSVNSVLNQYGVQLRFRSIFPVTNESFQLQLLNVFGLTGVAPIQNQYLFSYNPDYTAPNIVSSKVMGDKRTVKITLSETVYAESAQDINNYKLLVPLNDADNQIQSVSVDDNIIYVMLKYRLKYSNRFYYIVLNNISDLAGNNIISNQNTCRFTLSDIANLDDIVVFPNPVKTSAYQGVNFMNFPPDKKGNLAIYSIAGDLVYQADIGPFNPVNSNFTCRWNLINQSGKKVSSGIYYYVINMGSNVKKGKIAVLN